MDSSTGGISKLASLIQEAKKRQSTAPVVYSNETDISSSTGKGKREKKREKMGRSKELQLADGEIFKENVIRRDWVGNDDLLSDLSCDDENQSIDEDHNTEETRKEIGRGQPAKGQRSSSSVYADTRNNRTVFVGNSPNSLTKKKLQKMFSVFGKVEAIRMRSAAVCPGKLPVKVARRLKKQLMDGATGNWYVVMATVDEARQCLELNGTEVDGRHLRVDMATPTKDFKRTIFVGNLPFSADEEKLREAFSHCGEIESIRIVKDNRTGFGKGIAYVMFKDSSGVLFSIKQDGKLELDGRKLRISRCKSKTGKEGEIERKEKKTLSRFGGMKSKKKNKMAASGQSLGKGTKRKGIKKQHGRKGNNGGQRFRGRKPT